MPFGTVTVVPDEPCLNTKLKPPVVAFFTYQVFSKSFGLKVIVLSADKVPVKLMYLFLATELEPSAIAKVASPSDNA